MSTLLIAINLQSSKCYNINSSRKMPVLYSQSLYFIICREAKPRLTYQKYDKPFSTLSTERYDSSMQYDLFTKQN